MSTPMPQEAIELQTVDATTKDSSPSPDVPIPRSVMDDSDTQSFDNNKAGNDRETPNSKSREYYHTIMSQFSNIVLIATFAGGVQVAILSLMHDLLDPNSQQSKSGLAPKIEAGDKYSSYSLGILLGILAVALDLIVAIIAATNVAMASHLSLHPPQKGAIFDAPLLFCVMMQLNTAITSGVSLFLLSTNTDDFSFPLCVGASFFSGFCILGFHVWMLFGLHWVKRMLKTRVAKLNIASLFLSTLTCVFALLHARTVGVWLTTLAYNLTVMYHFLFFSTRFTSNHLAMGFFTSCGSVLCTMWLLLSVMYPIAGDGWPLSKISTEAAAGLEVILVIYMTRESFKELDRRHQRLEHIRVPTEPV